MRRAVLLAGLVALIAAGAASAKTAVTQQTGKATATSLDFACALDKNGLLRWVTNTSMCRKKETAVTIAPGPTHVCYQPDGSSRKVANQAACLAPGTYVALPPLNVAEYFCADSDGRLRHVSGTGQCTGSETELVVNPTNHAPTDITLTPSAVDENVAVGTVVGDLTSTDPDGGDTHTYTFTDNAGHPDNAAFTIDNSVTPRKLKTAVAINYEAKSSYSIMVRTTDAGGLFFEEQLTVTVNDLNEAPVADNETFTTTQSAVGNTTFVGDDPSDGAPATPDPSDTSPGAARPHKTITADILQGDADPEGAAVSVVPGTVSSTDAPGTNNVTLEADGDFTFEPKPGTSCTDHQDSFTYTITDGTLTGTGTVTIDIAGCVVYVNNNDAQGDNGTSEKPYNTLAQAETNSATGDSIFVYKGTGTTTGHTAGIDLKANQKLLGEAATLTVGSDTLHTGDATKRPLLTDTASNVVNLAAGNEVRGLQLDPQGGGGIVGGSGDAGGTIADVRIIDTSTAGTAPGLDLNGTSGTYNVSDLTVDTSGATSPTSADIGVRLNSAGTVNFASTGTISVKTAGAKGLDATSTAMGAGSVFDDITVTGSGTGAVSMTSTTGTTTFGNLALTTTSGSTAAFLLSSAGTVSVPASGTQNVSATGGPAIDVTGTSGATLEFDDVTSTSSATDGINIAGLGTGTFTASTGNLTGAAGIAFDLDGGSGTITYPGTLGNGTGATADITGRTGGAVTLSGAINDTNDTGGGITVGGAGALGNSGGSTTFSNGTKTLNTSTGNAFVMDNNTGHTVTLSNGGLNVDTTSGKGVEATGGGTIEITGASNTIDTTSGVPLNVNSTSIGANDLNFVSISANGAPNGILLNTTGANGGLNVNGTGSTDGSGGTIQSITNRGVSAITVPGGLLLKNMNFTNAGTTDGDNPANATGTCGDLISGSNTGCNAAIHMNTVTAPTIDNVNITGGNQVGINGASVSNLTLTNTSVLGVGDNVREDGAKLKNLTGTATLTNVEFDNNSEDQVQITNDTSTALTVNVTGTSSFKNSDGTAPFGQYGILFEPFSSANMTLNVTGATFDNLRGGGIFSAAQGSSTLQTSITGGSWDGSHGVFGNNDSAIQLGVAGSSTVKANLQNITTAVTGYALNAVHFTTFSPTTGNLDVTMNNVTVGNNSSSTSASTTGHGIFFDVISGSKIKAKLTNVNVQGALDSALTFQAGTSWTGTIDATIQNSVFDTDSGAFNGMFFTIGTTNTGNVDTGTACLQIGGAGAGNQSNSIGVDGLRVRQRSSTTVRLPGYGGGTTDTAAVNSYLATNNPALGDTISSTASTSVPPGGGFVGGASCATPALPTRPAR